MWRESKCAQDLPQQVTIDGVKSLCKVDEGNKNVTMLFPTFFLKKSCNENHIIGALHATKATEILEPLCQRYMSEDGSTLHEQEFTCDREKGNATAVAINSAVTFLLVNHYYVSIFPLCGKNIRCPCIANEGVESPYQQIAPVFENFSRYAIRARCLIAF